MRTRRIMDGLLINIKKLMKHKKHNGFILNGYYIPTEILTYILSFVDIEYILRCTLVCKNWNKIIKSYHLWRLKCKRLNRKPKNNLPWLGYYCLVACHQYFDVNLLQNGSGEDNFNYWNYNGNWGVESEPNGVEKLPDKHEFDGHKCCFAATHNAEKAQVISFKENRLMLKIIEHLQPTIYFSEWFACKTEGGCYYKMFVELQDRTTMEYTKEDVCQEIKETVSEGQGGKWKKVELLLHNYGLRTHLVFGSGGFSSEYSGDIYVCRMAGSIVKIYFDSINFHSLEASIKIKSELTKLEKIKLFILPRWLRNR